jgi:hypothetical protein
MAADELRLGTTTDSRQGTPTMIRFLHRPVAFLARLVVALAFCMPLVLARPAHAQAPGEPGAPAPEGEASGRPLDGYIGTTVLALLALFIVGKSARR